MKLPKITEQTPHSKIFAQNLLLVEENHKLYKEITTAAREKVIEYNDSTIKAIILSLSFDYVSKESPKTMSDAKSAYEEHLNSAETQIGSNDIPLIPKTRLPEPGKIHPYLEPTVEFPLIEESTYNTKNPTLQISHVDELELKVNRLFDSHKKCQEDQKAHFNFLVIIKNVFSSIYNGFINILRGAKKSSNSVQKHSDLAENIDNIANGNSVTKQAQLIHQFNSRPSPLVHVIYDKNLSNIEKEDLLNQLAQATPYRFKYEESETKTNINISSTKVINNIPEKYASKNSPLHHAVKSGTARMVHILLENNANPNVVGTDFNIPHIGFKDVTPLLMAVGQGDIEKVKLLIQYGANVNATNAAGDTALHAVSDVEIFKLLVSAGAKVNQVNMNGQTPLHFAIRYGKHEITKALIESENIYIDAQDNFGNSPLHLATAISFEDYSYSEWRPHYNFGNENRQRKEKSAEAKNIEIIDLLIKKGANVNKKNYRGYRPLHMAVTDGRGTIGYDWVKQNKKLLNYNHIAQQVALLCENGAKVNEQSRIYINSDRFSNSEMDKHPAPLTTPLLALYTNHSSESQGNQRLALARLKVAKYLVENYDAEIDLTYSGMHTNGLYQEEGNTLLHQCAKFSDIEAFTYFTSQGLEPNYQASSKHCTPFHVYVAENTTSYRWDRENSGSIMQKLFDNGVDINKTVDRNIILNPNSLNKSSGLALRTTTIMAIFKHDNIVSQKAKTMNLEVTETNAREILTDIYHMLLKEQSKEMYETIEIKVPLNAIEYSHSEPVSKAVEIIKKQQDSLEEKLPEDTYSM